MIGINQYRAAIGCWHIFTCFRPKLPRVKLKGLKITGKIKTLMKTILQLSIIYFLLILCGDIHPNPGPNVKHNKSLSIVHINARSLLPITASNPHFKLDEIQTILNLQHKFEIIAVSETWLKNSTSDTDVNLPGYNLYRNDRNTAGGGVAIYISDSLPSKHRPDLQHPNIESVWTEVQIINKVILIGNYYRPPNQNQEAVTHFLDKFQSSLDQIKGEKPESVLISGDFNDRCTQWDSDHQNSELSNKLVDTLNATNLHQIITEPTRITLNNANILDLIITDSPGYIMDSGTLPPIANLDHCCVFAKLTIKYITDSSYTRHIWSYKHADFIGLKQELENAPWDVGLDVFDTIDDSVDYFQKLIISTAKDFIPNRVVLIRPKDKPWMTNNIRRLFRIRDRQFKKFKKSRTPENERKFKEARHNANTSRDEAKVKFKQSLSNKLSNPKISSKDYWHTAKQIYKAKSNSGIPTLTDNNKSFSTSIEKANLLNDYFASQQSLSNFNTIPTLPNPQLVTNKELQNITATEEEVKKILKSLDTSKASGPDSISNTMLKEAGPAIAKPLTKLFNRSLSSGKFPNAWKHANVTPIFKKNNRECKENYRPVSLLSNPSKVLEKIVFKRIYEYCKQNNLLTWRNSGFKPLDSTINQLIYITNSIYLSLEEGKDVCMVFLDVSKAFDKIWHDGLIHKLKAFGIKGTLLTWLEDYLTGRKQRVVINGHYSEWRVLKAGVPQGSILGPLLFIIFINDIIRAIQSNIFLFADDTSLFREIIDHTDIQIINNDLQTLNAWSKRWLVTFNAIKTVYMIISRKKNIPQYAPLILDGTILKKVESQSHLGLIISNDFTWHEHIRSLSTKASKKVGLLWQLSNELPRHCLENIYTTCIRPVMEYGAQIFDNSPACYLKLLENVQRRAALLCTKALPVTHHNILLQELSWPTLSNRRKVARLNLLFKILNNLTQPYLRTACPNYMADITHYNLRNATHLAIPKCHTTSYQNSYFPSTIHDWNDLEESTRNSTTLETFKSTLKKLFYPAPKNYYHSHSASVDGKHLTRIRLGLSFLNSHQRNYGFTRIKICPNCNFKDENELHFFLGCTSYSRARKDMLQELAGILTPGVHYSFIIPNNNKGKSHLLFIILHGSKELNKDENLAILKSVQNFIGQTGRFT